MARAHGVIVEKHSQLSEEDPRRKYKGRGVVLGYQTKSQTSDSVSRSGEFSCNFRSFQMGRFFGWDVQMADAVQA